MKLVFVTQVFSRILVIKGKMLGANDGHEFGQIPGDSEGQGGLACCSPSAPKEPAKTEQLNNNT